MHIRSSGINTGGEKTRDIKNSKNKRNTVSIDEVVVNVES